MKCSLFGSNLTLLGYGDCLLDVFMNFSIMIGEIKSTLLLEVSDLVIGT
jgi:hypothetical protein